MQVTVRFTWRLGSLWVLVCALCPLLYSVSWTLGLVEPDNAVAKDIVDYLDLPQRAVIFSTLALPSLLQYAVLKTAFPALTAGRWWGSLLLAAVAVVGGVLIGTVLTGYLPAALREQFYPRTAWLILAPLYWMMIVMAPCAALAKSSGVGTGSFVFSAVVATCCESALTLLCGKLGIHIVQDLDSFMGWEAVRLGLAQTAALGAVWGAASAGMFALSGSRKRPLPRRNQLTSPRGAR